MHHDVKQYFRGSNVHCGSCSHERIQYGVIFPAAGCLNGSMLTCLVMWLGGRVAARAIFLSFQIGQRSRTFTIPPTTSTYSRHLGFERYYNSHTAFRACYVIVHNVQAGNVVCSSQLSETNRRNTFKMESASTSSIQWKKLCTKMIYTLLQTFLLLF